MGNHQEQANNHRERRAHGDANVLQLGRFFVEFADQQADSIHDFDYSGPAKLWNAVSTAGHGLFAVCVIEAVVVASLVPSR